MSAPGEGGRGSCGRNNSHRPPLSKFVPVPKIREVFGVDEFREVGHDSLPPQIACAEIPVGGGGGSFNVATP